MRNKATLVKALIRDFTKYIEKGVRQKMSSVSICTEMTGHFKRMRKQMSGMSRHLSTGRKVENYKNHGEKWVREAG